MPIPPTPTLPSISALPPPAPELAPAPVLSAVSPTIIQPRRSTKINFGQPAELLDPSVHVITQYTNATDHFLAPLNNSLVEHLSKTLGLRLPSGRYGRIPSKGGPRKYLYATEDGCPKIKRSRLYSLYLASLNWTKLIYVLDPGLSTLSPFSVELLRG